MNNLTQTSKIRTVVLTRPLEQVDTIARALAFQGVQTIKFPLISICPVGDARPLYAAATQLANYALVIFVSPNAIHHALRYLPKHWPRSVPIGVVGSGSAQALAQYGVTSSSHRIIDPSVDLLETLHHDSEALALALEKTLGFNSLVGRKVLIVRAETGRMWLIEHLQAKGIEVETVAAYRRTLPCPTHEQWARVCEILNRPHAWWVTSSESLRHLDILATQHLQTTQYTKLKKAPMLITHPRIAESARALDFCTIAPTGFDEASIMGALRFLNR
jgi:uroporphyrinogen III methyltransferase/synthase